MKIAISGKGGVGKTTLTALLARSFAAAGCRVLAIDADPDANLATALGIPLQLAAGITPVAKMKALAEERTGAQGGYGSLFKLNPTVSDLPKQFCVEQEGVRFLWMGTLDQGGSGCACPESTFVRRLMGHLMLERQDVVILDMEAGIEHLGRGTAEAVDALITVVEPGERSLQTAAQIRQLAADIGIRRTFVVGSKLRDAADESFLQSKIAADELLGFLPYHDEIRQADRNGEAPTACGNILAAITTLRQRLQHLTAAQTTFATAS
ncbi:MAG: carbon monoxide dehydrogenase [Desulfuromonas sp.]|nr:MAG: carbon monoxide dehydrogenase [Desulfuromonas sp.]